MTFYLLLGMSVSCILFFVLFQCSNKVMDIYFFSSDYIKGEAAREIEKLQKFVDKNQLRATDVSELRQWSEDNKIYYFTISRARVLLYDNNYRGDTPLKGARSEQLHVTWEYFQTVNFADGAADVLIYKNSSIIYYVAVNILVALLCFMVCLIIFFKGLKKEVDYIKRLNQEVEVIHNGKWDSSFTLRGRDELSRLAKGLDVMRSAILEREEQKRKMKIAQDKLVLGMAHDIRTPLTALMNYQEVIRRQNEKETLEKPIHIIIDKTCQIRDLSEQLFEFFLVNGEKEVLLEEAMEAEFALSDYCSELYYSLCEYGFVADSSQLQWREISIRISYDFLGRIINNILSNIQKYAERKSRVYLSALYKEGYIGLSVKNRIGQEDVKIKGNKIGVENIKMMMKKMKGKCEVFLEKETYQIILWFPEQKMA